MFFQSVSSKCYRLALCAIVLCLMSAALFAQDGCPDRTFPVMKQKKVTVTIPGTDMIKGYLEALPETYNASAGKRFPLMIFFHGANEGGDGSAEKLCLLVNQWWWAPPSLIELDRFPHWTNDKNGQPTQFILISAQLAYFGDPSKAINPLIDYLQQRYRVDASRIYLTGLSAGANFIMSYAGASAANANRVAGIAPVSPCMSLNTQQATVIARANLAFYSVQCSTDGACSGYTAANNAALINQQNPTLKAAATTLPVPNWACNSFTHDAWGTAYDTTFKQNINGRNLNMYEWMLQNERAEVLPVVLKDYQLKLVQGKVVISWTTSYEHNNAAFLIERAGQTLPFTEIGSVAGSNNATGSRYQWTDENPLPDLNQYRLVQVDQDGAKEYFGIKTILNRAQGSKATVIAPNPFKGDLTVYLQIPRAERVRIVITDVNGKRLYSIDQQLQAGTTPLEFKTAALSKGIYFLKIEGRSFTENRKIVKQ
ncbi:T9SS type A sorting domain-containing protein [Pseudoflavitalea rhizosphaerae]|uniref:T9SS type A sorting domain-containing protein n=1 Tax=Pseudoflavitalea rhizosphaerae TaxID=1884793 RepID=UPI000F8C707D|nr:T9SS type A sorting domain-containing protein [Pseudoflavitalea rhizosphaerae]